MVFGRRKSLSNSSRGAAKRRLLPRFLFNTTHWFWITIVVLQWLLLNNPVKLDCDKLPDSTTPTKNILYGNLHIAKTAGSILNRKLIVQYERVCGNKGYSYDALRKSYKADSLTKSFPKYTRGFLPWEVMLEIGFEDCDLVMFEENWMAWPKNFGTWPTPVELHVPCRDPIDHLMSQCYHMGVNFNCTADWKQQIRQCLVAEDRFSKELIYQFPVKCYNAKNIDGYIQYMGDRLQKRRMTKDHVYFGKMRKGTDAEKTECIWKHPQLQKNMEAYLTKTVDYYDFCVNKCMGTKNELPLLPSAAE